MNEVPEELIFNWDQTALKFMATGKWTMNRAGEQIVMITNSDDKRQVMAVFAATLTGELQPPPRSSTKERQFLHAADKGLQGRNVLQSVD